jgi:eukaryotic-like serine/threonine-protein kinase
MSCLDKNGLETRRRYTLYDELASGGMATLHLGLQTSEGFARVVAIKQLRPEYADDNEFIAMFRDEVRLASRVVHPNVVPILDVVSANDDLLLVMDYLHGLSVAELLKAARSPLPPEIAITIIVGVLHGLHAAHEACSEQGERLEIVHRDVTPQNVIVGVDGTPRVLDFGIAHAMGRVQTTKAGQVKGKLAYMAPEQLGAGPIDRRVDVYSSSVMLWEMLSGRRRLFSTRGERQAVVPASFYQKGISSALDSIVRRGLENRPERRFATALDMAVALEDQSLTVSATQLGDWVRRLWGKGLDLRTRQIAAIESGAGCELRDAADENRDARCAEQTVALRRPSVQAAPIPPLAGPLSKSHKSAIAGTVLAGLICLPILLVHWNGSRTPTAIVESGHPARFMPLLVPLSATDRDDERHTIVAATLDAGAAAHRLQSQDGPRTAAKRFGAHSPRRPSPGKRARARGNALVRRPAPAESVRTDANLGCNPAFIVDGAGIKRFKLDCLE